MSEVLRFTVEYEPPDEAGGYVARVREVPSALSFGRTRDEARANVLDALKLMLSPEPGTDDEDTLGLGYAPHGFSGLRAHSSPDASACPGI